MRISFGNLYFPCQDGVAKSSDVIKKVRLRCGRTFWYGD